MTDDTSDLQHPHFVGLLERGAQVGRWVWVERRVFEVFGRWAGTCGHDGLDAWFADMSRRHGWHAEVLADRLPEISVVDVDDLVVPGGSSTEHWFSLLEGVGSAGPYEASDRAVGAYRVLLPMLVVSYRTGLASMSAVAEPSLMRWVDILLRDDLNELAGGEGLVQSFLVDDSAVEASSRVEAALGVAALGTSLTG